MSIANITKRTICNSLALPCNRKHSERFNILIQNRSINYSQKDYWCLWRDLECFMSRCSTTPSTTEDWKKIAQEFLEFRLFFQVCHHQIYLFLPGDVPSRYFLVRKVHCYSLIRWMKDFIPLKEKRVTHFAKCSEKRGKKSSPHTMWKWFKLKHHKSIFWNWRRHNWTNTLQGKKITIEYPWSNVGKI